ncbi:Leucine-rich repeat-containing protein [Ooceraea biroi]|uniref:Leucine-rich repeat-containing protein n=1 Tax=Ooceraea biroi TaxID=2015173 RepID=A0A026WZ21_OOCBI|nr:Leucine-rich repeat-containing protein [Ooceraea biroi]
MQTAPPLLSFLLILLYQSGSTHGLCNLDNDTAVWCHKLEDLKTIDTQNLEYLKILNVQDTLVPDQFSNLDNLKHLDLSNGDLKNIEPRSFRTLNNLRSLNLGDNHIEDLELSSLEGLIHLRSLNLRRNAIRQLPPALARLKSLKHLDIHSNPLQCNCATLKVRDLIVQRGVTVSKKVVCAGPGNMKGTSLMKPTAAIICSFEQQDREMQNDQAHEGSGTDLESEDVFDQLNEEDEEEEEEEEKEEKNEKEKDEKEEEDEYVEVNNGTSEKPKEPEIETPFPTGDSTTKSSASIVSSKEIASVTTTMTNSLQRTTEDEIFFDSDEKKEHTSTISSETSRKDDNFKDGLFYPTSSSGDGDDGSGEGSGAGFSHYDEEKTEKEDNEEPSFFSGTSILDAFFGLLGTTAAPTKTKVPELEEEQFIDASSTEVAVKETIVPSKSHPVESDKGVTTNIPIPVSIGNSVEVLKSASTDGESKSGNVKAEVDSLNDEQANTSLAKQSKKGMGSYVVLGILLAVVAGLIGFAAYRGKLCNKKRKRSDVENGTELKDMQKSLLPDAGNATQPKIASNGNTESVPLVEGAPDGEDAKADKIRSDDHQTQEAPRSLNGGISPMQPFESSVAAMNNGPTTHGISEPNGPPLSPGAQRVKITLQEIPDSVPKTPILITRTMAGENLVKTP